MCGRGGGDRTPDLRFWRPSLFQLSYTPFAANSENSTCSKIYQPNIAAALHLLTTQTSKTFLCYLRRKFTVFFEQLRLKNAAFTPQVFPNNYSITLATTPAPTVRPPSRMAKRKPCSIATGAMSVTIILMLSPGITISVPSGNCVAPVTSVVRK
jgi:hypothetical protein